MLNLLAVLNGLFEPRQFSMDIYVYNMLGFLTSLCIYGILGGPQDYIYHMYIQITLMYICLYLVHDYLYFNMMFMHMRTLVQSC